MCTNILMQVIAFEVKRALITCNINDGAKGNIHIYRNVSEGKT